MRGLVILMFCGAISAGFGLSKPHAPLPANTLEQRLQMVANKMNAAVPRELGAGMVLKSVRAEGRVIHFRMTGMPDWREANIPDEEVQRQIAASLCSSGHTSMLDDGAIIKVELQTPGGGWMPDLTIDHCPKEGG